MVINDDMYAKVCSVYEHMYVCMYVCMYVAISLYYIVFHHGRVGGVVGGARGLVLRALISEHGLSIFSC